MSLKAAAGPEPAVLAATSPDGGTTEDLPYRVYSPESALRHPRQFFREMLRDLLASRELAWRLFVRDTSARYRQSLLGYLWAFLPPIASTFTFVFLNYSGVIRGGDPRIPYPAFVMVGTLIWQVFADAIITPIKAVNLAKPILAKVNFPREAVLLAGILEVMFNFLIRLTLVIPVFAYYKILPGMSLGLALLGVLGTLCLGFALGVLLTPVGVLYTDIGQGLTVFLSFWMLFSPVVYSPPAHGALAILSRINPVTPLIVVTREWLILGYATDVWSAAAVVLVAAPMLLTGWIVYRVAMPLLIERMGG